jgi:hypothetical protein
MQILEPPGAYKIFQYKSHTFKLMNLLPDFYGLGWKPTVRKGDHKISIRLENPCNFGEYLQRVDKILD